MPELSCVSNGQAVLDVTRSMNQAICLPCWALKQFRPTRAINSKQHLANYVPNAASTRHCRQVVSHWALEFRTLRIRLKKFVAV